MKDEHMNDFPVQCVDPAHDIAWMDETDDFDFPVDLDRFCRVTVHECTNKEAE